MAKNKRGRKRKKMKKRLGNKNYKHLQHVYYSKEKPSTDSKKGVEIEKDNKIEEASSYIKKDLRKTFIITTALFLILVVIFLTQNLWQPYINK